MKFHQIDRSRALGMLPLEEQCHEVKYDDGRPLRVVRDTGKELCSVLKSSSARVRGRICSVGGRLGQEPKDNDAGNPGVLRKSCDHSIEPIREKLACPQYGHEGVTAERNHAKTKSYQQIRG